MWQSSSGRSSHKTNRDYSLGGKLAKTIYNKEQSDALWRAISEGNPRSNFYRVRLAHTDQDKNYCPESLTFGSYERGQQPSQHPLTEVLKETVLGEEVYNCSYCKRQSSIFDIQMAKRGPFDQREKNGNKHTRPDSRT